MVKTIVAGPAESVFGSMGLLSSARRHWVGHLQRSCQPYVAVPPLASTACCPDSVCAVCAALQVTVSEYSRCELQTVRSCLVPVSSTSGSATAEDPWLLLASSDDRTCTPLIWSLGCGSGPAAGSLLQRLDPHPTALNCLAAGAGADAGPDGGTSFLACGSESRVAVYRRRCE